MNQVEVWLDDQALGGLTLVGHLTRNESKTGDTVRFDYSAGWLENAGPIAAFGLDHELDLVSGPLYAHAGADRLSGIFVDCSPDRWGKMLMERREAIEAREQQRKVRTLRSWDFLLGVHDESRMGALRLRDAASDQYLDFRNSQ